MSISLQWFLLKMHQLFGLHNFRLVETQHGFRAKCSCGAYLRK